ncbi:MAG: autotransporter outer membrane beta-barrel domain-containing protein [Beijerinckiaceae bacterium]
MRMRAALLGALLVAVAAPATAQNFNQFAAFGDSTTDTGWFAHASIGIPSYDASIAASLALGGNAHYTGPGAGNAQILAAFFGLTANPANTPGGTNYAIGSALDNGTPGFENLYPISTGVPNPALPGTATQINNYLASVNGQANPNALYLISSGVNSTSVALSVWPTPTAAANAYLLGEAQALTNSVARLQADGARHIIVADEYSFPGITPTQVAYVETIFGATWRDLAAAGVKFIPADTQSVISAVENNPTAFGIIAPITSPACVPPGFSGGIAAYGTATGYGVTCAPTTTPSTANGYLVSANALQTHLFMDDRHLTEAGQLIIADYYYNLLVAPSEISFLAETAVQTTLEMVTGIQQQIDVSQRQRTSGWNGWVNGQLSYLQMNNDAAGFPNDPGFPISGTMGVDYRWQNGWLAGGALTAGQVAQTFSLGGGYSQDDIAFSLYSAYRNGAWWGDVIGSAGWLGYSTNRLVPIGITIQPNNGSTNGSDLSLAGEVGYDFETGWLKQGPVAGLILQRVNVGGFTESGSFTSLAFAGQTRDSEVSALGYRASFDWGQFSPYVQAVWNHELDPLNRSVTASLTTVAAPSYSMPAVQLGRDWATATIGTRLKIDASWTGLASFTAQLGQTHAMNYTGMVGLNCAFNQ